VYIPTDIARAIVKARQRDLLADAEDHRRARLLPRGWRWRPRRPTEQPADRLGGLGVGVGEVPQPELRVGEEVLPVADQVELAPVTPLRRPVAELQECGVREGRQ
jgi:hypothetical protein